MSRSGSRRCSDLAATRLEDGAPEKYLRHDRQESHQRAQREVAPVDQPLLERRSAGWSTRSLCVRAWMALGLRACQIDRSPLRTHVTIRRAKSGSRQALDGSVRNLMRS